MGEVAAVRCTALAADPSKLSEVWPLGWSPDAAADDTDDDEDADGDRSCRGLCRTLEVGKGAKELVKPTEGVAPMTVWVRGLAEERWGLEAASRVDMLVAMAAGSVSTIPEVSAVSEEYADRLKVRVSRVAGKPETKRVAITSPQQRWQEDTMEDRKNKGSKTSKRTLHRKGLTHRGRGTI